MEYKPIPDTEYNRKMQEESKNRQAQEIVKKISILEKKLLAQSNLTVVNVMDLIEEVVSTCGGESKLTFNDVSYDFIRVHTRVPMSANLFPFMSESPNNPRFHKVVTKLLLMIDGVRGVRWLPSEERGSYIVISLKRD
jgi:hypothetical protein